MVLGEDSHEEAASAPAPAAVAAEIDDAPSAYNVEMMESIVQRLRIGDRHQTVSYTHLTLPTSDLV